jgi:hypothetical protein
MLPAEEAAAKEPPSMLQGVEGGEEELARLWFLGSAPDFF